MKTPIKRTVCIPDGETEEKGYRVPKGFTDNCGYFFTPDQLNEYTQNVIKQALETAAEKAKIKEDELETESYTKADEFAQGKSYSYTTDMDGCLIGVDTFEIDKQSITSTFEETFKQFEV